MIFEDSMHFLHLENSSFKIEGIESTVSVLSELFFREKKSFSMKAFRLWHCNYYIIDRKAVRVLMQYCMMNKIENRFRIWPRMVPIQKKSFISKGPRSWKFFWKYRIFSILTLCLFQDLKVRMGPKTGMGSKF